VRSDESDGAVWNNRKWSSAKRREFWMSREELPQASRTLWISPTIRRTVAWSAPILDRGVASKRKRTYRVCNCRNRTWDDLYRCRKRDRLCDPVKEQCQSQGEDRSEGKVKNATTHKTAIVWVWIFLATSPLIIRTRRNRISHDCSGWFSWREWAYIFQLWVLTSERREGSQPFCRSDSDDNERSNAPAWNFSWSWAFLFPFAKEPFCFFCSESLARIKSIFCERVKSWEEVRAEPDFPHRVRQKSLLVRRICETYVQRSRERRGRPGRRRVRKEIWATGRRRTW